MASAGPHDGCSSKVSNEVARMLANKFNPRKLLNSKWTAVEPVRKQKHFIVTEIEFDEDGSVITCMIEAVMSKRIFPIQWQELKNQDQWIQGWK
jgi:tryptophan-rich hypothetical protein